MIDDDEISVVKRLVDESRITFVSSIDEDGYPNCKAMFNADNDSYTTFYISTNMSSKRTAQFKRNSKASLYFCDENNFKGVMFVGDLKVCTDYESRKRIWQDTDTQYYPLGIDDPDYCVYVFKARYFRFYPGSTEDQDIAILNNEGVIE